MPMTTSTAAAATIHKNTGHRGTSQGAASNTNTIRASANPVVSPPTSSNAAAALQEASLRQRLSVDKNIVDELLLVCGVIGTTEKDGELVPVTDCLNWLQDLQRALRRDDDLYRPVSLLLGQWKIVEQKLLPLILHARYDSALVLTVCKILVILTKPLADNTVRAGKVVIDTKPPSKPTLTQKEKEDLNEPQQKERLKQIEQEHELDKERKELVIAQQKKLRENALRQAETLLEYKRVFCHHPSHLGPKKGQEGGLLSVFVSLLAEPLSRTGNARTDSDHLTIELVLHLLRNLLAAEPLLGSSRTESLHHELITLFDRELVLELLLVLAADIEQRENAQYNLLLMELLHHLLRNQDPLAVAKSSQIPKKAALSVAAAKENSLSGRAPAKKKTFGALSEQLRREKQAKVERATSRHSHFGGTLVVKRPDGRRQMVSAATLGTSQQRLQPKRRRNRKAEPFIGALQRGSLQRYPSTAGSATSQRAAIILHKFCVQFVENCYGPVMKSIKNEFRRDSVRLEDGDRVVFFQVAWFFCQWWRLAGGNKRLEIESKASSCIGQLIFTMDVFTFNLVLNATDTFYEHRRYMPLAQAVALLSEMMHLLHFMYTSTEPTEQIMAMGLMDRLYYRDEPLDRLPKLLARWTPGTSTREYLCDLVECCHMTLKLLDANAKASIHTEKLDETAKFDTLAKMKAAAAEFDVNAYFGRKIVSNHTVFAYTQLLMQYSIVAPTVNHRVVAFFWRICKHRIALGVDDRKNRDYDDSGDMTKNPLVPKEATFEPMLYNVHMLTVLNSILNDMTIRTDKDYASLLHFATKIVHNFATAAQANPMLFVEAIFKHALPHRYCVSVTNMYVTEDLRMFVERDLRQQNIQRMMQEEAALQNDDDDDDDDSDEELEFTDLPATKPARALVDSEDEAKPAAKRKAGNGTNASANKRRLAEESLADSDVEDTEDEAPANKSNLARVQDTGNGAGSDDEIDRSLAGQRLRRLELLKLGRKKQKELSLFHDGNEDSSSDSDDDLFSTDRKTNDQDPNREVALLPGDSITED